MFYTSRESQFWINWELAQILLSTKLNEEIYNRICWKPTNFGKNPSTTNEALHLFVPELKKIQQFSWKSSDKAMNVIEIRIFLACSSFHFFNLLCPCCCTKLVFPQSMTFSFPLCFLIFLHLFMEICFLLARIFLFSLLTPRRRGGKFTDLLWWKCHLKLISKNSFHSNVSSFVCSKICNVFCLRR